MYTPKDFRNNDLQELHAFIRGNSFGLLVTQGPALLATHIPMMLSSDGSLLQSHIARANPQGKHFSINQEVLVVFQGPHTYVSSSWYDHENVPSWNYIAVHAYGKLRVFEGEELLLSLKEMTDHYEAASSKPVRVENMSPAFLESHLRAVIGFEIRIDRLEATYKLSQNRDPVNHENIILELEKRGDFQSKTIASEMKKRTHKLP